MSNRVQAFRKRANRITLALLARLVALFARIVPYRAGVWSGGVIGSAAYLLLRRERSRTLSHLSQVFPEKDREWIRTTARASFIHLGRSLLEFMLMTPRRLEQVVTITGEEHLKNALAMGKGVIFVTGHIGSWELMAQAVGLRYPLGCVAAPIKPEAVNKIIVDKRARMGVRTILRSRPGAAKELIRSFRENRVLGLLIDQDTDVDGAFIDFMGKPAWTPTAAASMSIKFGAPVLFGFIWRNPDNHHIISIEGPLDLHRSGDEEKDIIDATGLLTKKIEDCIMKNPEQWVWMHRRWRRQP